MAFLNQIQVTAQLTVLQQIQYYSVFFLSTFEFQKIINKTVIQEDNNYFLISDIHALKLTGFCSGMFISEYRILRNRFLF